MINGSTRLAFLVFLILFVAVMWGVRSQVRRNSQQNSLRQIALAIDGFEKTHGHYPPAYLADDDGSPLHSWRVLILPFLGEQQLYDQFDLKQPWDAPDNVKLVKQMPDVYRHVAGDRLGETRFRAIIGPTTMWPSDVPRSRRDMPGRSIAVVVETPESTIWTKPDDANLDEVLEAAAGTNQLAIGFQDGHTGEVPHDRVLAKNLFTIDNGSVP